jgi:hypothetical protein
MLSLPPSRPLFVTSARCRAECHYHPELGAADRAARIGVVGIEAEAGLDIDLPVWPHYEDRLDELAVVDCAGRVGVNPDEDPLGKTSASDRQGGLELGNVDLPVE